MTSRRLRILPVLFLLVARGALAQAPDPNDEGEPAAPEAAESEAAESDRDAPGANDHDRDDESDDPPNVREANERLARGEALFEQGDFDAALAEWERAYEIIGDHPSRFVILYNIARAHERRFRYDLALRYYHRYLNEGGTDAPRREAVEGSIATLEGLLATVHVRANVAAEVWVEDRRIGDAPGAVRLPGGRHVIELRAAGYEPAREEVQVAPRTEATLELELSPLAEEFEGVDPGFFAASLVGAGVSLLSGVGFGTAALVERADVDARNDDPLGMTTVGPDDQDRIRAFALTADVSYGAALLFGATALVFALLTDWDGEAEGAREAAWSRSPLEVRW